MQTHLLCIPPHAQLPLCHKAPESEGFFFFIIIGNLENQATFALAALGLLIRSAKRHICETGKRITMEGCLLKLKKHCVRFLKLIAMVPFLAWHSRLTYESKAEGDEMQTQRERHKRRPCEDGGRDWSDAAVSQRVPKVSISSVTTRGPTGNNLPKNLEKECGHTKTVILDFRFGFSAEL